MEREEMRDEFGALVGWIDTDSDGRKIAYVTGGYYAGTYQPNNYGTQIGTTFNNRGFMANGDCLYRLFWEEYNRVNNK